MNYMLWILTSSQFKMISMINSEINIVTKTCLPPKLRRHEMEHFGLATTKKMKVGKGNECQGHATDLKTEFISS